MQNWLSKLVNFETPKCTKSDFWDSAGFWQHSLILSGVNHEPNNPCPVSGLYEREPSV